MNLQGPINAPTQRAIAILCLDVGVALRALIEARIVFDAAVEQVDIVRAFAAWAAADRKYRAAQQAAFDIMRRP